jgi:hypothetical protein
MAYHVVVWHDMIVSIDLRVVAGLGLGPSKNSAALDDAFISKGARRYEAGDTHHNGIFHWVSPMVW